jgi:hypothetical protein
VLVPYINIMNVGIFFIKKKKTPNNGRTTNTDPPPPNSTTGEAKGDKNPAKEPASPFQNKSPHWTWRNCDNT